MKKKLTVLNLKKVKKSVKNKKILDGAIWLKTWTMTWHALEQTVHVAGYGAVWGG